MIDPKTCCQIAVITRDLEKTAKEFSELFHVPVPIIDRIPEQDIAHVTFKGRETPTRARLCCFDMGQLVLELIEPDEHDSCYKEALKDKDVVFHHIGFMGTDSEGDRRFFEAKGCPVRQTGEYSGGYYVVSDSIEKYGFYFNLKYHKD
jgi:hypothetical protein